MTLPAIKEFKSIATVAYKFPAIVASNTTISSNATVLVMDSSCTKEFTIKFSIFSA